MNPLLAVVFLTISGLGIWVYGVLSENTSYIQVDTLPLTAAGNIPSSAGADTVSDIQLQGLRTFRGANVDGALRINDDGTLMITLELRRWIDFHLAAQGELPLADIIESMQLQIARLPEPARTQANELLQDYLGYLEALQRYDYEQQKRVSGGSFEEVVARTRWQQRLRQQWFSPTVVEAFFRGDELLDNHTIDRMMAKKRGASPQELNQLEAELPPALQLMRRETRKLVHLEESEQRLRQEGGSDADIQQWREQQYGAEAAQRLQKLDERRFVWRKKIQDYMNYQKSLSSQQLDRADQEKLLSIYRQKHFSEEERKRLKAATQIYADNS